MVGMIKRKDVIRRLSKIVFGKPNDAVKLIFLDTENELEILDKLDLTMLSEIKRGTGGSVEVKLLSRIEAMKLLLDAAEPEEREQSEAGSLLEAIDSAAKNLGEGEAE